MWIARDFSKPVVKALTKKGVRFVGPVAIPGEGDLGWANATRGYSINDNGTFRVLSYQQVLDRAQAA